MSYLTQFIPHAKVLGQGNMFTQTATWSPVYSGWYYIAVFGGGGSGAGGVGSYGYSCLGGNAGSTVIATRFLDKDVTYTAAVGGGGVAKLTSGQAGGDGTASQFTGSGLTSLIASGGKGGIYTLVLLYNQTQTAVTRANADNAASSGGDFNLTGGKGGQVQLISTLNQGGRGIFGTGGGAVRVSSTVTDSEIRGGDVTLQSGYDSTTGQYDKHSTGGAGVRGQGGSIFLSGYRTDDNGFYTSGGGGRGRAVNIWHSGNSVLTGNQGTAGKGAASDMSDPTAFPMMQGRGGSWTQLPKDGGGGCAEYGEGNPTAEDFHDGKHGAMFGGGGGCTGESDHDAGTGGFGGGGGGGCALSHSSVEYSGAGGQGVIFIAQAAGPLSGGM
jgi:hypothetical protein